MLFFTYKLIKFLSLKNGHGSKKFYQPSRITRGELLFQKNRKLRLGKEATMELLSCLRCLCGWDNFLSYFSPPDLVTIRFCREHQILMSSFQIILVSWLRQEDANSVSERISRILLSPLDMGAFSPSWRCQAFSETCLPSCMGWKCLCTLL